MNITEQVMQGIRDQYYHWGGFIFDKNTVHMLIILILIMIFVCIVIYTTKEKE